MSETDADSAWSWRRPTSDELLPPLGSTTRVPMILNGPGVAEGVRTQGVVASLDLFATVLDIFGLDGPATSSRSLPVDGGRNGALGRHPVYSEALSPKERYGWASLASLRNEEWLYIEAPREELYPVGSAPGARNLAENLNARERQSTSGDAARTQGSSRALKENLEVANGERILQSLDDLSLYEWSYIDQGARHVGPMAEEFAEVYGLGESSAKIAPSDMAGVALAAVKTLRDKNTTLEQRNEKLERQLGALLERVEALEVEQ